MKRTNDPPWLTEALRFEGVKEVKGPKSNPILTQMGRAIGLNKFVDDEPWCTMFCAYCLLATVPGIELPRHLMWSRAFASWGRPLTEKKRGAIMVYWRGKSMDEDIGHVGFYLGPGLTPGYSRILSANMSDMVKQHDQKDEKLVSIRWPIERGNNAVPS